MKTRITIRLSEISKINKFNRVMTTFVSDIDAIKDRYIIDAKSVIGLHTLNLSNPIDVEIHSTDEKEIERFNEEMKEFE